MAEERTILPALDFPPAVIITKIFACAGSIIVGALIGLRCCGYHRNRLESSGSNGTDWLQDTVLVIRSKTVINLMKMNHLIATSLWTVHSNMSQRVPPLGMMVENCGKLLAS